MDRSQAIAIGMAVGVWIGLISIAIIFLIRYLYLRYYYNAKN
ncbi:hypothetical protein LCGC14_2449530 [marine sediment metagenome]|uniref:Uncharacterized protein n=1 Tax=marine sediment metagenome TaxID=412755 RepID=A0A0F9BGK7_9ZZZZ